MNNSNSEQKNNSLAQQVETEVIGLDCILDEKKQDEFIEKVKTEAQLAEEKKRTLEQIKDQMIKHNHNKLENEKVCFKLREEHASHRTDVGRLHKEFPDIYAQLQRNTTVRARVKMIVKKA